MRVRYSPSFMVVKEADLSTAVEESILDVPERRGQIEDMKEQIDNMAQTIGSLVELLVKKHVIRLSDIEDHIAATGLEEIE